MRPKPRFLTYLVAILSVLAAIGLRILWKPLIEDESPFLFFFAALAFSSWFGGMRPGILATFLGAFSVHLLGFLPVIRSGTPDMLHLIQYLVFIAIGSLISFFMGRLHAAFDRSARAEHELDLRIRERTKQLVEVNSSLQKVSIELIHAQETERLRISKELHDDLGQSLTLVKLKIGLVDAKVQEDVQVARRYCADALLHVDQAIENMRRLSRDLSPVTVETLGISTALRRLADEFNAAGEIRITTDIAKVDNLLPLASAVLFYRVIQEALNNMTKHSGATAAEIRISLKDGEVGVEVKDNGKGMDLREGVPSAGGLGLAIMAERVRALGGTLGIESRKGSGTRLRFSIPARSENGAQSGESGSPNQGADI